MQVVHKAKRKKKIFVYIFLAIALVIINPFDIFKSAKDIIMKPVVPILRVGFGSGSFVQDKFRMITSIGKLYRENEAMSERIVQLESEKELLGDVKNENDLLREAMNLLPRKQNEFIGAEVVLRDPVGGDQWVMIDRGGDDGVKEGNAVVVGENIIIGVIDVVDKKTSQIKLITHPDSSINVASARTGSEAIAHGKHGLSLVVEDIKKDDDLKNGDMFITSSIGNSFSRGLSVGNIQNIGVSEDNLFQIANINPLVSLNDLRFVFVIK